MKISVESKMTNMKMNDYYGGTWEMTRLQVQLYVLIFLWVCIILIKTYYPYLCAHGVSKLDFGCVQFHCKHSSVNIRLICVTHPIYMSLSNYINSASSDTCSFSFCPFMSQTINILKLLSLKHNIIHRLPMLQKSRINTSLKTVAALMENYCMTFVSVEFIARLEDCIGLSQPSYSACRTLHSLWFCVQPLFHICSAAAAVEGPHSKSSTHVTPRVWHRGSVWELLHVCVCVVFSVISYKGVFFCVPTVSSGFSRLTGNEWRQRWKTVTSLLAEWDTKILKSPSFFFLFTTTVSSHFLLLSVDLLPFVSLLLYLTSPLLS